MKTHLFFTTASALLALSFFTGCDNTTELTIQPVGDTMAYNLTQMEAKAGSKVTLTLKNVATSPAMQHDWILVQPGKDAEVSTAAYAAGAAKDYIPESPSIIAHTKLTKPGESDTITFTAPSTPGDYPYLCTFPGHYPMMKGVLKVN
jgi:azurin